jgi:hypothetical protein
MFSGKLKMFLCSMILAVAVGLGGCVTMQDGSSEPDYAMVEFGSVAAFTVIVSETKVSDETVVKAYEGLSNLETTLQGLASDSGNLDLSVVDRLLANAVPMEYKALASQGSKLIRSRVRQYMGSKDVLDYDMSREGKLTIKTTLAVVQGARAALYPKYVQTLK